MMNTIIIIITSVMLFCGVFFFVVGVIGLLRLPDVYSRLHATTKCDTLGVGFILTALAVSSGDWGSALKLLAILVFIWLTNPTAAHAIARAAFRSGTPLAEGSSMIEKEGDETSE